MVVLNMGAEEAFTRFRDSCRNLGATFSLGNRKKRAEAKSGQ